MNNPPAFPRGAYNDRFGADNDVNAPGMTLRDYFAAKAMQGILSNSEFFTMSAQEVANEAWLTAAAMLKEREANYAS